MKRSTYLLLCVIPFLIYLLVRLLAVLQAKGSSIFGCCTQVCFLIQLHPLLHKVIVTIVTHAHKHSTLTLIFRCKNGGRVKAHQAILGARSSVFAQIFAVQKRKNVAYNKNNADMLEVEVDESCETIQLLLRFVYKGSFHLSLSSQLLCPLHSLRSIAVSYLSPIVSPLILTHFLFLRSLLSLQEKYLSLPEKLR